MASIYDFALVHDYLDTLLAQSPSSLVCTDPSRCMPQVFETLHAIAKVQAKLDVLRAKARAWNGPPRDYSMSPFSMLPVEMVMRIFDFAVSEDDTDFLPVDWKVSVCISHVCRKWRDISLAQSALWNCVSVASERQIQLFNLFAARAGVQKMELEVVGDAHTYPDGIRRASFSLTPPLAIMKRLRSVRLYDVWSDECFAPSHYGDPLVIIPSVIFLQCPVTSDIGPLLEVAQELSFTDSYIDHEIPDHRLTLHHLQTLTFDDTLCRSITDFFEHVDTPALRRLTLTRIVEELDEGERVQVDWEPMMSSPLTNLEVLTLGACCGEMWVGMSCVPMPQLRELHLFVSDKWSGLVTANRMRHLLSMCGRALTSLHLAFDSANTRGITGLAKRDGDNQVLCPLLRHLHVSFLPGQQPRHLEPDLNVGVSILQVFRDRALLANAHLHLSLSKAFFEFLEESDEYYYSFTEQFSVSPQ